MKKLFLKPKQPVISNMASTEKVNRSLSFCEAERKDLIDQSMNRFQRYLDGQDDTIIGGLSDQINTERMNSINAKIEILKDQIEGSVKISIRKAQVHFLINPAGDIVSTRLFAGDYGYCFITNEKDGIKKFISLAKRFETFKKKGVIICAGQLTIQIAEYLHSEYGFVTVIKYGAINPVVFNSKKVNTSVGITPELEDHVKKVNTQKWINYYSKKENQYKY